METFFVFFGPPPEADLGPMISPPSVRSSVRSFFLGNHAFNLSNFLHRLVYQWNKESDVFVFSEKNLNPQIKGINLQKWAKFDCFFNFLINCALNVSDFLYDALDKFTLKSNSFIFYPKILLTPSEGYFNFTHLYISLPLCFCSHA